MNIHAAIHLPQKSWLNLARGAWIIFALAAVSLNIASQIASWHQMQAITLTAEQIQRLQVMGLTAEFYSAWRFSWQIPLPLFWGGVGMLIFLRRSHDRAALIVSAMMLGAGLIGSVPLWTAFAHAYPQWIWVVAPMAFVSNLCLHSFFAVFPTGRFVPRWMMVIAIAFSALNILNSYAFALPPSFRLDPEFDNLILAIYLIATLPLFVLGPFYRYRWRSTPTERQQIKWVVFATGVAFICFVIAFSTAFWAPNGNPETDTSFVTVFVQPVAWTASFQFIPIAIGISILRYRLFDIDVIIRRTLQYSILTGLLGLVYFGGVVLFQGIFRTASGETSSLAVVLSTLIIAALFTPLRRRIQNLIDRRFYRQKYDAVQVLARFATVVRDEVEMEKLASALVSVVDETVQPESISLWVKDVTTKSDQPGALTGQRSA